MSEPTQVEIPARASDAVKHMHALDQETADVLTLARKFGDTHVNAAVLVYPCGCVAILKLTAIGQTAEANIDLLADGKVPALYEDFVAEVVRLGQMQAQVRMAVTALERQLAGGLQS